MASSLALAGDGPWRTEFKRIDPTDPVMPLLTEWQSKLIEAYRKNGNIQSQFGPLQEISSESLPRLFPGLRFIAIHWDETPVPGNTKKLSMAYDLYTILAVDSIKKTTREFYGYGNYEEFGILLSDYGITINSHADAKLVWNAFCDLHQKQWKNQDIQRIDDTTWHLGAVTIDRFHYYYQVDLDSSHKVIRGKLHADRIKS